MPPPREQPQPRLWDRRFITIIGRADDDELLSDAGGITPAASEHDGVIDAVKWPARFDWCFLFPSRVPMNNQIRLIVAAYYRMSSDDQVGSIEQQQQIVRAFAAQRGWTIATEYIDRGKSGSKDVHKRVQKIIAMRKA